LNIDEARIFSRPGGLGQRRATDHRMPALEYVTCFLGGDSGLAPSGGGVAGNPPSAGLGVMARDHAFGRPEAHIRPETAAHTATAPAIQAMGLAVRGVSADA
jgi:hypothetical protein